MTDDAGPSGDASPTPDSKSDDTASGGLRPAAEPAEPAAEALEPAAEPAEPAAEAAEAPGPSPEDPKPVTEDHGPVAGPLLEYGEGEALQAHDRQHSGPGGEPACPRCGTQMVRMVEQHRAPRSDDSAFRIRLVCGSRECGAWTTYNW